MLVDSSPSLLGGWTVPTIPHYQTWFREVGTDTLRFDCGSWRIERTYRV